MTFITSNIKTVQNIVELCFLKGVEDVIISPGSRNAPLTIAFNQRNKFNCYSIVDERSAAFFALGVAQQKRKPVVVVCTSGSAAVNYYPAVVEAFYQNLPLVVITADRPQQWIDQGVGQTIRQENVFQNHILFSANLSEDDKKLNYNNRLINNALNKCLDKNIKGPVHINVPLSEPLYNTLEVGNVDVKDIIVFNTVSKLSNHQLQTIKDKIESKSRVLLLSGTNYPDQNLNDSLTKLTELSNVVLLTETTSNIDAKNNIACIDKVLNTVSNSEKEILLPDLVITFGGAIVSKMIKNWLLENDVEHWHISKSIDHKDTFNHLTTIIESSPVDFFNHLSSFNLKDIKSGFADHWNKIYLSKSEKHKQFFEKSNKFSDLYVFERIFELVPKDIQLQLSNSSVIRYAQLFEHKKKNQFANRGTSGIDGSTGTAIGAAVALSPKPVLFITGDISFFYDSNSLWNNAIPNNFKIILINNSGGGIFKIIPGPAKSKELDKFFVTKHNLKAKDLANTFDFEYMSFDINDDVTLDERLLEFLIKRIK